MVGEPGGGEGEFFRESLCRLLVEICEGDHFTPFIPDDSGGCRVGPLAASDHCYTYLAFHFELSSLRGRLPGDKAIGNPAEFCDRSGPDDIYQSMKKTLFLAGLLFWTFSVGLSAYDPFEGKGGVAREFDLSLEDPERNRTLPVRVYLPAGAEPAPVVLFSHGLGGSREGNRYLAEQWAERGYAVLFLQHPGSDAEVWKTEAPAERFAALEAAANVENFLARTGDVGFVLDELDRRSARPDDPLYGRLDLRRVGMSGHSFGAMTTQAVSGQRFPVVGDSLRDPRIDAAVAMSPSSPSQLPAGKAFGEMNLPLLLMTGTEDGAPIGDQTPASRLRVYPALPPGDKYQIVLHEAEHSAFSDRSLPGDRLPRNPNHHQVILALTTAFWDAYLREDPEARAWLQGPGPRTLLEPEDTWEWK